MTKNNKQIKTRKILHKENFGDYSNKYILTQEEIELPKIGEKYLTWIRTDIRIDKSDIYFANDQISLTEGLAGNINLDIKCFHGWRGTTGDISSSATGVRICTKAQIKHFEKTAHVIIEFGKDLTINQK